MNFMNLEKKMHIHSQEAYLQRQKSLTMNLSLKFVPTVRVRKILGDFQSILQQGFTIVKELHVVPKVT